MCSCAKQLNSTVTDVKEKPVTEEKIQEVPDVQVAANKAPAQSIEISANSGSSAFTKYIFPGIAFIAGGFAREYAVTVIRKFIKSEWGIRL